MYKKSKTVLSKLLVITMLLSVVLGNFVIGNPVFASDTSNSRKIDVWDFGGVKVPVTDSVYSLSNNNITAGLLDSMSSNFTGVAGSTTSSTINFGDLKVIPNSSGGDRFYYYENDSVTYGVYNYLNSTQTWIKNTYSDGYIANGAFACNGAASSTKRYITIDNVVAGDKISIYGGLYSGTTEDVHFLYTNSSGQDEVQKLSGTASRLDFVAKYSGQYKIYMPGTTGTKPYFHRVVRTPGVKVSGSLTLNGNTLPTGYSINFTNQTTNTTSTVTVNADNTFNAVLAPGYSYIATLKDISAYTISDPTKVVSIATTDIPAGVSTISFNVITNSLYTVSGNLVGFDSGYDLSKLAITFAPPTGSLSAKVTATVDTSAKTYTADVQPGVAYTAVFSGVNDYQITAGGSLNVSSNTTQDITVAKKPTYTASGTFLGLSSTAQISSIKFTNVSDGYVYTGTVANGGYTVSLRDGAYSISAVCSESYSTIGHVVVSGQNVTKDVLFDSTNTTVQTLPLVKDLYVGDSSKTNNYSTVKEALAAAAQMNPTSEDQRITIHIAPGTYRAQLKITTPYITLVNSDPTHEVKLTWYYGIGYKYYSAATDGFYNASLAFDKYSKNIASNWGATVYLSSAATAFRAENIVFENSFNKYMTQEEITDGVELAGIADSTINVARTMSLDVKSKAAQERGAAMVIYSDHYEFKDCSFIGGQDTLFTGNSNVSGYFKNTYIEGNTDYIYGDGNIVFEDCTLNFAGYSDSNQGGYLTAAKDVSTYGYLFKNSVISNTVINATYNAQSSYFGRPWGAGARVTFMNSKLQSSTVINAAGWTSMSTSNTPQNAHFAEYNTTYNGSPVDTSGRVVAPLTSASSIPSVSSYFGSWTPVYYVPPTTAVLSASAGNQSATLTWDLVANATSYTLKRGTTSGAYTTTVASNLTGTSYTDSGLDNGTTYYYVLVASNSTSELATSNEASVTPVAPVDHSVPAAFISQDIGTVGVEGSASYDRSANEFTVTGSGTTSTGYTLTDLDSLRFVGLNSKLTGDGTIIAKVNGINLNGASGAVLGLMVRTSLEANSNNAAVLIKPAASSSGTASSYIPYYFYRDATQGKNTSSTSASAVSTASDGSFYLKLAYQGSSVSDGNTTTSVNYRSYIGVPDSSGNIQWTLAKSTSTKSAVSNSYYIGMFVVSNDQSKAITVNFDNVTIENKYDTDAATPVSSLNGMGVPTWSGAGSVTPSVASNGDITLTWKAAYDNVGITKYNIYEGTNLVASTTDGSTTAYKVTKAMVVPFDSSYDPTTKPYTFTVKAVDAAGNESKDGLSTSSDIQPPSWTSGQLTATGVTQNSMTLNWSGASDNIAITGYKIYDVTNSANKSLIASVDGSTTSYKVTKLNSSTAYKFEVEAGDSSNNWSVSGPSLSVSTTAPIADYDLPTWTSGQVTASGLSQTGVTLTWTHAEDNVGVEQYYIYNGVLASPIATLDSTISTYKVQGLAPSTSYTFTVQAVDEAGNISVDGPSTSVTTPAAPSWQSGSLSASYQISAQPNAAGPVYTATQRDAVTLTWNGATDPIGVTGYNIFQDGIAEPVAKVDGSTSAYTVIGLAPGASYTFRVEAIDQAGASSSDGPVVNVSLPALDTALLPPVNVSVPTLAYDDTSITLVWSKPDNYAEAGIADYNVYMDGVKIGNANNNAASLAKSFIDSFYNDSSNSSAVKISNHTYTVTGLTPNTAHTFTVRSVDQNGNESADSNSVTQATTATPQVYDVTQYGAAGDGTTVDTAAIQRAIDAAPSGSKVLIPAGKTFVSGSLYIRKSDITFQVDGTLKGSSNAADFPYPDSTHKTVVKSPSLLNATDAGLKNIRIIGTGTIDGNGWKQGAPGADGLPISLSSSVGTVTTNGILAASQYNLALSWGFSSEDAYKIRSNLISLTGVTNVFVGGGLSIVNPSQHTLSVGSDNITLDRLKVLTYDNNNGDGVNLSGTGLTVINSVFDTGDDNINFAAGVGKAAEQNHPVENVWIFNNYFRHGHGALAMGSNTAAWIQNIIAEDNVMNGIGVGLRAKTGAGIGGGARNVMFRDTAMKSVADGDQYPFEFTSAYPSSTSDPADDMGRFKHMFVHNVSVDTSTKSAIFVSGTSEASHEDIHFTNVSFNKTPATSINYLKNSSFINVTFTNVVNNAAPWAYTNTSNVTILNDTTVPSWTSGALTSSNVQANSLSLNWTPASDNVGVTAYRVLKDSKLLATVTGSVYTYNVTGLNAETGYTFTVQARDTAGNWTANGPSAAVTTLAAGTTPGTTPADTTAPAWSGGTLTASSVSKTSLVLTWNAASDSVGVTGYKVYNGSSLLTTLPASVYSFYVTNLSSDTSYTFSVQAGDSAGNWSANGPSVTVRTDEQKSSSSTSVSTGGGAASSSTTTTTPSTSSTGSSAQSSSSVVPAGAGVVATPTVTVDKSTGVATASVDQTALNNAVTQAKADNNGTKTVVITVPKAEGATAYEQKVPAAAVNGTQAAAVKVAVSTEVATVVAPSNMLSNVQGSTGAKEISFTIAKADVSKLPANVTSAIGSKPVVELNVAADGKRVEYNNPDAPVTISIPYKPTAEEAKDLEHLVVVYIDGAGNLISVPSGKYNPATNEITFTTTHFSKYAVAFVHKSFTDLTKYAWAEKEIGVMASKGIISGTSDVTFTPASYITRADFLHLLIQTLDLHAKTDANFDDVNASDYYADSLAIAKKLGITDGIGNNKFDPKAQITRQDMMVLIERAMHAANKLKSKGSTSDLAAFSDKNDISSYAAESVSTLVKEGIVQGNGNTLNPLGNATRAETAVMMYRIYMN